MCSYYLDYGEFTQCVMSQSGVSVLAGGTQDRDIAFALISLLWCIQSKIIIIIFFFVM